MANSMEVRVPFLGRETLEYAWNYVPELRKKRFFRPFHIEFHTQDRLAARRSVEEWTGSDYPDGPGRYWQSLLVNQQGL